MTLEDRTALVTGSCGEGMGRSTALRLAREGANLVLNYGTARRTKRQSEQAAKRAGLKCNVSLNTLRHSFATIAVQSDAHPQKLADAMGTSTRMLERVYVHHGVQSSADVIALMPDPTDARSNVVQLPRRKAPRRKAQRG